MNDGLLAQEMGKPVPRRRAKVGVAWTAIFLCLVVVGPLRAYIAPPASNSDAEDSKALGTDISVRYAVGASRLQSFALPAKQRAEMTKALLEQVDRSMKTPNDRLRGVILAAEIDSAEEGLRRLGALRFPAETEWARDQILLQRAFRADGPPLDDAAREHIVDRFGWSGRLALTWGRPDDDPARAAVLRDATRTFAGGFAATLAILAVLGSGLFLLTAAILRWRAGRMTPSFAFSGEDADVSGTLIEAFALYLTWFVVVGPLGLRISGGRWPWLWSAVAALGPIWCLWPLVRGVRFGDLRRYLGWTRGAGTLREMGWGLVGYAAGTPIIVIGIVVTYLLASMSGEQPVHPAMDWIVWDLRRLAAVFLLVSVYAPLAEETMFRGALLAGVRGYWGSVASTTLVAFIFAALHPQGWTAIPALMSIAVVLSLLREWRGSSIAPMTAHALNNGAVTLVFALVAG